MSDSKKNLIYNCKFYKYIKKILNKVKVNI